MLTNEQWVKLRKWWFSWGWLATILIVIAVMAFGGWHFWYQKQSRKSRGAAQIYHNLLMARKQNNDQKVVAISKQLKNSYGSTVYADIADFMLARVSLQQNQEEKALAYLKHVMTKGHDPFLKQLARIKVGRVLNAQGNFRQALKVLDPIEDQNLTGWAALVKSDAYLGLGEHDKAQKLSQWGHDHLDPNSVIGQLADPGAKYKPQAQQ